MKVRKLKTRIAAFGLAVLMGISTLSSANAFAAEQTGSEQQTEVQASEQAVTSQKDTSVTADDITKAVSDDTFAVETSMEGIHYDAEKEDVTLVSIKERMVERIIQTKQEHILPLIWSFQKIRVIAIPSPGK